MDEEQKKELKKIANELNQCKITMESYYRRFKQFAGKFRKQTQLRGCLVERNAQLDENAENFESLIKKLKELSN